MGYILDNDFALLSHMLVTNWKRVTMYLSTLIQINFKLFHTKLFIKIEYEGNIITTRSDNFDT